MHVDEPQCPQKHVQALFKKNYISSMFREYKMKKHCEFLPLPLPFVVLLKTIKSNVCSVRCKVKNSK